MATSISKRVVFVKTKNKPKRPPPKAAVVQAGSGQMVGGPATSSTPTFGQAPQPVLANPPFWTLEWWEREWQMVVTILAVLLSLGTLIYFVATSDYKNPKSGTKAPDRVDSPRRNLSYPGSDSGGGSAANRLTPNDEGFMAAAGPRQQGRYDGKPAGNSRPSPGRESSGSSAAGNERIAPEAGECVLTAKAGAGLAGEIGECLRPGSKK